MDLISRLPDVGTTIFTIMSGMAQEHGAINLSQGFPDFEVDPELTTLVTQAMQKGHNQYAPMAGVPILREAIAQVIYGTYGVSCNPETEITITAGATEAIYSVVGAFVRHGDEVIVFDPAYDSYNPAIRLNGGVPVHLNLRFPNFRVDWNEVRTAITPRTRMIIVNTPHNPLGTVMSEEDLKELESIALQYKLIVLSDEVYERLVFDGKAHTSVLSFPALAEQSFACFSFGKTFHATGWKVGYVVGPAKLMAEVRKVHQFIVFSVNTPVQIALAEYLRTPAHYENVSSFYEAKRDFFLNQLKDSAFAPLPSSGSYFQLVTYEKFSNKPDTEVAFELTRKHKVASIPVSVFYQDKTDNHLLRFCFAKNLDTLARAGEILRNV